MSFWYLLLYVHICIYVYVCVYVCICIYVHLLNSDCYCCCSAPQPCPTLCDPMDCSMQFRKPGFLVLHHLPELAQTHVHWVSDAIQPSCPLLSPSPPAFYLSQHQSLLQWVCSLHQVAEVLELQLQHQSFQWIISVQSFSRARLFAIPWTAARQASLCITNSWSLLKLMSIESVMPSNHIILCCPLLLLPSIFPQIRVFSNESVLRIRWPKFWSFSFSTCLSNEFSGLISFRIGWFDLLSVQGTLKSLLQHHCSKASILQRLVFFIVQLSHPYMTTGEIIALTRWTFVSKVISLLFNMLSRFVIAFYLWSAHFHLSSQLFSHIIKILEDIVLSDSIVIL